MGLELKANVHYDNIPKALPRFILEPLFIDGFNEVANTFNRHIDELNDEWHINGGNDKPIEEYNSFIRESMQPHVDRLNKSKSLLKFRLNDECDIEGFIPGIKDSRIWVTLEEVEL